MEQPQMDWSISNLDLVEPNQVRDVIYACIRLLLLTFYVENVADMHILFTDVRPYAGSNVDYFLFL